MSAFGLSWNSDDEANLTPVQKKALAMARWLALEGEGESKKLHGFTIVIGDSAKLRAIDTEEMPIVGRFSDPTLDFETLRFEFTVHMTKENKTNFQRLAGQDGAIIVEERTGKLVGGKFFCADNRKGDFEGGNARHQAASALAQHAGGCFVIKASEDVCTFKGAKEQATNSDLDVFFGCKTSRKVPVHPPPADAKQAPARLSQSGASENAAATALSPGVKVVDFFFEV